MSHGMIKWFNETRGFGFIQSDQGEDVFVHRSGLLCKRNRRLTEGLEVEFDLTESPRGPKALNVRVVSIA